MSSYGLSCDQIADVLERDPRTILQWQQALGQKSQGFHLTPAMKMGLTSTRLQWRDLIVAPSRRVFRGQKGDSTCN
jgi:hypothetical protein